MQISKCSAFLAVVAALFLVFTTGCGEKNETLSVLIIDGQNNHAWQATTPVLTQILGDSGKFEVTISTSPPSAPRAPRPPKEKTDEAKAAYASAMKEWEANAAKIKAESGPLWDAWRPDFAAYDVVVSNYNGELWPEAVRTSFEAYVSGGGGFVAVHAANNSFPEWPAYNEMIGVGGWGGRSELSGPYLRLREGSWVKDPIAGKGGSHGARHEFVVETQDATHPIVKGLPEKWLHAEDELYDRLRGPAKSISVLAAAKASEEKGGSGEVEPLLMTIDYGTGRVFHTTLGHDVVAMSCLGFQETLKRGVEWAATGDVTFAPETATALNENEVTVAEVKTAVPE